MKKYRFSYIILHVYTSKYIFIYRVLLSRKESGSGATPYTCSASNAGQWKESSPCRRALPATDNFALQLLHVIIYYQVQQ